MVLCGLVGPWGWAVMIGAAVMMGTVFPASCFSILSMEERMEATCAAKELTVLVKDLIPSKISGDALALHVCETTVWGCREEKEGMGWTGWLLAFVWMGSFLLESSMMSLFWWRSAFSISAKRC